MKYLFVNTIAEIEPLYFSSVDCKGSTDSTAADPGATIGNTFAKIVLVMRYIDASNYGVLLPQLPLSGPSEVDIFADGPNGASITVFLRGTFVDGTTSITIPCGTGKTFKVLHNDTATFQPVIGVMG